MSDPAYFLSWSSAPGQHGWTAELSLNAGDQWRTLLSWTVYRIGSGRRRMMVAILIDLDHPSHMDSAWIGHLHTTFEHRLRITVTELLAVLDDGIPTALF